VTLNFPRHRSFGEGSGRREQVDRDWRLPLDLEEDRLSTSIRSARPTAPGGLPERGLRIVPTFGTNFHTSLQPLVATGCTGPLSCEGGQTIFDPTTGTHINAVCDCRQRRLPA